MSGILNGLIMMVLGNTTVVILWMQLHIVLDTHTYIIDVSGTKSGHGIDKVKYSSSHTQFDICDTLPVIAVPMDNTYLQRRQFAIVQALCGL